MNVRPQGKLQVVVMSVTLALVLALGLGAETASAKAPIEQFSTKPSTTQAGGHGDLVTEIVVGNRFTQGQSACACNDPKELLIHAPAGVVANPHVLSVCTAAEAAIVACSPDSQAGFVVVRLSGFLGNTAVVPIYRAVPQAGQAALFQFRPPELSTLQIPQYIAVNARTGTDYGLDIKVTLTHVLPPEYIATVFWGTPGLPSHDPLRFKPKALQLICATAPLARLLQDLVPGDCTAFYPGNVEGKKEPVASSLPIRPFTQNPTACLGPLPASIDTVAYDHETAHADTVWPATTGCSLLSFDPSLSATPTTTETDSAAGLDTKLVVPQFEDPKTPSPSEIKASTVTLPEGFSINPNAADGKTFCTDEEAGFGTIDPSNCPEFAKIGTDVLDTAALPEPISGAMYLGEPLPGDRYRIIVTAGGFGTFVKIAGSVHPDPQTGQLVISFPNLPQAPFQEFDLHLFGSERGLLATPTQCGTYPVKATFTPWDDLLSEQTSTQFFVLDSGPGGGPCPSKPRPLNPELQAGNEDNTAGRHSPLTLRLARADGDQNLTGVDVTTPPGFTASLRGIPYCPQAAIDQLAGTGYLGLAELASSACPPASQIGTAVAGAGAGTRPIHVNGKVYLAGPYKGAPLSLIVVIPAVSGPYDLGNVAVRAAISVDQLTGQVRAVSDPLPQILDGIPLRTRLIQVKLDRAGFTLNPTNCEPASIDATVFGDEGGTAALKAPFAAANCVDLPYGPKLGMKLSGGLNRRGHPAIHAVLSSQPGEANSRRISVTLPKGELLDNAHIRTICTRVDFAAGACPAGSQIGQAEVSTPLLDQPLRGQVYLRASSNRLPDIVLDLKGQVNVLTIGRIDSVRGRLRTTFEAVPDLPFSSVVLDLEGGSKGLLINSENLCGARKKANVEMTGQNGRTASRKVPLQTSCGSKARHKRHKRQNRTGAVG